MWARTVPITLRGMREPAQPARDGHWLDWGGSGPPLHFAHGNGFPPATYRKLIETLRRDSHVVSMEARPLWPGSDPQSLSNWPDLARDLKEELERRGLRGSVGVGHSLGAVVTLLAAAEDPGLFKAVVAGEDKAEIVFTLAEVHYDSESYKKAAKLYKELAEEFADTDWNDRATTRLARCYHKMGETEACISTYMEYVNRHSEDPRAMNSFAAAWEMTLMCSAPVTVLISLMKL